MKIDIDQQKLERIKEVRSKIVENLEINDRLYNELIEELGLKKESKQELFLFDAVYNSIDDENFHSTINKCNR